MKSLIIKSVIMVVVMVGIGNYSLYLMTGKSPFTQSSGAGMGIFNSPDNPTFSISSPPKPVEETVFKWVDENGITHFSKEPPKQEKRPVETLEVGKNVNIIQSFDIPEPKAEKAKIQTNVDNISYNPANVKKLIEDAQNVQQVLNDRMQEQESILSDL